MSKARKWSLSLKARSDIQAAVRVLGRRSASQKTMEASDSRFGPNGFRLDLRGANLQAVDAPHSDFRGAQLERSRLEGSIFRDSCFAQVELAHAHLEGADFSGVEMKNADLAWTQLEATNFGWARMECTNLYEARMEGTDFLNALLAGSNLYSVTINKFTDLRVKSNFGSAVRHTNFRETGVNEEFLASSFGDGTVDLPGNFVAKKEPLSHWKPERLDWDKFQEEWYKWQVKIGYRHRD